MPHRSPLRRCRARRVLALAAFCLAAAGEVSAEGHAPGDIDSEHLFGFTEGSDLGAPGEIELEWDVTGRAGKRAGRFRALDSGIALKMPLTADFRLAPGLTFAAHDTALAGAPARTSGGVNGAVLETRLRLLDRRAAPFGLTFSAVPSYAGIDGGSGLAATGLGGEFGLLADAELVPGRLVAAVNACFGLSATTLHATGERFPVSGIEIAGALAHRVEPGLFLGGEMRYARAYEGLTLDRLAGEALYLGPTLYAVLSPRTWISLTWNVQMAGRAAGEPGPLDLSVFDRHQMRMRVGYMF